MSTTATSASNVNNDDDKMNQSACVLLETSLGDLVIDLDCAGSPRLAHNFIKLVKARYYTQNLVHTVVLPGRFAITGDATGTGTGGASVFALLEYDKECNKKNNAASSNAAKDREVALRTSTHRFLKSTGQRRLTREECREKGRVVAVEFNGVADTVGSQFLITTASGENRALDGYSFPRPSSQQQKDGVGNNDDAGFLSLGRVVEDESNVLDRMATDTGTMYCDDNGRPFADIRIHRALIVHDPFDDPPGMAELLKHQGVIVVASDNADGKVLRSPSPERPEQEEVQVRIPWEQMLQETIQDDDPERERARLEQVARQADRSRAVVLEMLGDLPSADITAPENVLFVCKLNAITTDEDLELIFSRFDPQVKVVIIRDHDTGQSLQYAFCEFTTKEQAAQAYFKMDNALVDDRRIKVDFSQSVAKMWDRYNQRIRRPAGAAGRQGGGYGAGHGGGGVGSRGGPPPVRQQQRLQHQQQRHGPPQNTGPRSHSERYNRTGNDNDRQRHFSRDNQHAQQPRGADSDGRGNASMDHHRRVPEMPERRRDVESNDIRGTRENNDQGDRRLQRHGSRERGNGESYHGGGGRDDRKSSSRDNKGKDRRTGEHRPRDERRNSRRDGGGDSLDSRGHANRRKEHKADRRSRDDETPKDRRSRGDERKRGHDDDAHSNDDSSRSGRRSERKYPRDDRSSEDEDHDSDSSRRRKKKHKHKEGRHKERSDKHQDRRYGHESRRRRRDDDVLYDQEEERPRKRDVDRERKRRHRSPPTMHDDGHDKDGESSRERHRDRTHHHGQSKKFSF
jgi:peptidyl-prolyl cis-trans isomerase-like 4